MTDFPLFPDQASTIAQGIDYLYFFLVGVSAFFSVLIFGLILYFAVRYRHKEGRERIPEAPGHGVMLEVAWFLVPLVLVMTMFVLGANLFFSNSRVPRGAMDIYVVGKQWMWKIQHTGGKREINELHVPVNQPIRLTLASEDVIHSFYVPAFRVKQDVVPGRFQTMWFEATRTGEYHLFCAEYCGTQHSGMVGRVVVMEPDDFQQWLELEASDPALGRSVAGSGPGVAPPAGPAGPDSAGAEAAAFLAGAVPAAEGGERLFADLDCSGCHGPDRLSADPQVSPRHDGEGPPLAGRFGESIRLESGERTMFDENYFRRALLDPGAELTAGFGPLMPTYRGQVTEAEMLQLLAYVRALGDAPASARRRP